DGIRVLIVTGVQTCALPIWRLSCDPETEYSVSGSDHTHNQPSALEPAERTALLLRCRGQDGGAAMAATNKTKAQLLKELAALRQIGRASCRERVWSAVGGGA